jgi:hypothetical protein
MKLVFISGSYFNAEDVSTISHGCYDNDHNTSVSFKFGAPNIQLNQASPAEVAAAVKEACQ